MQMKHLLVALVVLLALVGTAAAASVNEVEIRSTIIHYNAGTLSVTEINATNWAGLYYDLDNNVTTEKLELSKPAAGANGDLNITYTTVPRFTNYEYDGWRAPGSVAGAADAYGYAVIGYFAESYVALGTKDTFEPLAPQTTAPANVAANKLAKLIIDDDEKYTLKTGATLEIGSGYSIIVDQIDVDGNKAYLKLMQDGKEINSTIINTREDPKADLTQSTWVFNLTVLGDKNMQVMRVHVKDVFQGTESSLVEIDGLWMVDYLNATEVKSDDKFGKFECSAADKDKLIFDADEISLSSDAEIEIGAGIFIKTESDFSKTGHVAPPGAGDVDKFYFFKEYTEPGVYELRSSVFAWPPTADATFDYTNFSAFFYDMDNNVDTETLKIVFAKLSGNTIEEGGITYNTTPELVNYEYDWANISALPAIAKEQYYIMGFFGEKYVPFNIVDVNGSAPDVEAEKMAKLIIDDDEKYTLKTGATLELGEGYTIIVDQIDVDGNKAYLKFLKDGKEINSSIVNTNNSTSNWILRQNISSEKNVQVLRVHVKDVFQGTQDSLVEIDGLWLMDYQNSFELKSDDKFGILEYDGYDTTNGLMFSSGTNVTFSVDMDKQIANNMYLKTADNATYKNAYFYVNAEIGEGNVTPPDVPSEGNNTTEPPITPPTDGNNSTPTPDPEPEKPSESFWSKYMWYIIGAIVLIIIIAGAAYYFMVYKKQA